MQIDIFNEVQILVDKTKGILSEQDIEKRNRDKLVKELEEIEELLKGKSDYLDTLARAATLVGNVSDENTKSTLNYITNVINKALATMFKNDGRRIHMKQIMYRNTYPHYIVELETLDGQKRTFKQSGTGLAQIISFLFTICLIDARKGRKIMVMDELLNGLHPDAKAIIHDLIKVLSKDFQFIIVEYGLDIGKQYEVVKEGSYATVSEYVGQGYYKDLGKETSSEDKGVII